MILAWPLHQLSGMLASFSTRWGRSGSRRSAPGESDTASSSPASASPPSASPASSSPASSSPAAADSDSSSGISGPGPGPGPAAATLTSLPQPLLHSILVSAAGSAGGAVRSCRTLRDAWRAAMSNPVLAARFLVNRHGRGAAAVHAYAGSIDVAAGSSGGAGGGSSGGSSTNGGAIIRALLRGLPVERHDEAALALVRALAAEGALGMAPQVPGAHPAPQPPHHLDLPDQQHQDLLQPAPPPPPDQQQQQQQQPGPLPAVQQIGRLGADGGPAGLEAVAAILRGAACANHTAVVRELVTAGAPRGAVAAALQEACRYGNEPLARQLLQAVGLLAPAAAPATARDRGTAAATAWRAAEPWPELAAAELLAPALAATSQGRSPRHLAVMELLLAAGADPRVSGGEALVRACAGGSSAMVRRLLRAGADPRVARCRPLVAAAEVLRLRVAAQLLTTGAYSYGDLSAVARELLVPPLVSKCASLAALLLPWLAIGALLLTASAPVVFGCVLLCLWNGLWVVSALSAVGYGLGLALAAAAVGLAVGLAVAAWATSAGLLLQFLLRATLRRIAMDGAAAAAAAAAAEAAAAAAAGDLGAAPGPAAAAAQPTWDLQ